jgi:DNA invertase Pin-like site-specific DNA recombinase
MPAKDFLDLEEKKNLQKALKEEERAEVRERILMFLLLNDGKTQREIADFIGCSLKTVKRSGASQFCHKYKCLETKNVS